MAKEKVIGTILFIYSDMIKTLRELGYQGTSRQIRIICKCKSLADANRKCEAAGLGSKVFCPGYASDTSNEVELNVCETTDIALCLDKIGKTYVPIEEIRAKQQQ